MKAVKVICILCLAFFSCLMISSAVNAESSASGKDMMMAQAMERAQESVEPATAISSDAFRQKLGAAITVEEEERETKQEVDTYVRYMPGASTKGQSGRVSLVDSAVEYSYDFKAFGKIPVELGIGTSYVGINSSVSELYLPATLTDVTFGAEVTLPLFGVKNTYVRAGAYPSFSGEKWQMNSSNFLVPTRAFVIYQPEKKLTFIAGVAYFPGYECPIYPIGGVIYIPNDKWTFNLVPSRPTISYSVNDKLDLFVEGGLNGNEYKIKKDGKKNTQLAYNDLRMGAGVQYSFTENIDASFSAGGVMSRSLKYRDSGGKVSLENGPYIEVRVEAKM